MISEKELTDLALLARLKLSAEEKKDLTRDISAILDYVEQLKAAPVVISTEDQVPDLRNVLRPDDKPHLSSRNGEFFEQGRLVVKAIFDQPEQGKKKKINNNEN